MNSFSTVCPKTGSKIASFEYQNDDEVNARISSLQKNFELWKKQTPSERAICFRQLAGNLRRYADDIARSMEAEMGKTVREGLAEVEKSAFTCDFFSEKGPDFLKNIPVDASPYESAEVALQPLGIIFCVMPWNFPVWQLIRFAIPALMGGNVVLLKHSDIVAGTAELIVKIINKSFQINLIENVRLTHELAARVIAQPLIRGVTFTGSTEGGRAVASVAAKSLKKTVLELGGNDAYLVLEDADIGRAAELCARTRLINAGQSCVAGKRFIISDKIYSNFFELFKKELESAPIAPLASKKFQLRLQEQVDQIEKAGGKVLLGGKIPSGEGAFYPPTIIECQIQGADFHSQELFGPVALLFRMENLEQGIQAANFSPFGLGGGVFTQDLKKGKDIIENHLEAGFVVLNDIVKSDPRLPFGGVKHSGYGRELGMFGLLEFVNIKTLGFSGRSDG